MITERQLEFQTPADANHQWAETLWLGLHIPEANLYGWVYQVFRAGVGVMTCDVEFVDRCSDQMFDARYVDIHNHLPIPASLRSYTLPNGLSFESHSPRSYRLDYVGVDDTEMHLDIAGIHEPYDIHDPNLDPMAQPDPAQAVEHSGFGTAYAGHFDLTARVTGTVKVRGTEYPVDCLATQNHSWGPRPERGMRPMGYVNAQFEDGRVVQSIWGFDPTAPDGQQHTFKHGYLIRDGQLTGAVAGSLGVRHRGMAPAELTLAVTDADGRTETLTGVPATYNLWVPYGSCPTGLSMVRWTAPDGSVGYGTSLEGYPLDAVTGGKLHSDIAESAGVIR
ncbi:hypothetical protein GP2_024_00750 [Gordonia paraffinivorans NBRC 108238]|uniref:AttH domain-containing protein n=1 Tax=Gordonia paraffinivorans NBRC 108238 TaxID=1223543 RepID=A0ABQ0IMN4_9ACTN|nr:hypothetical protein [Gordonia paraffinivorans]GAC84648.1 hypothetical protein GP2_024_00750 [Gordonia paraffinivorans NBRC 108238]